MDRNRMSEEIEAPSDAYTSEVIGIIERLENDRDKSEEMDMEFSAEYYEQLLWYLTDYMEVITMMREETETV